MKMGVLCSSETLVEVYHYKKTHDIACAEVGNVL